MQNRIDQLAAHLSDALRNTAYPTKPEGLYEPIAYVLDMGGKRLRPMFLMLAAELYADQAATTDSRVLSAALGIETYHNYTLLHDDLMDRADMRRGRPTVHKRWDANTAILSGDSMLVLAFRLIHQAAERRPDIMSLFIKTALEIGEGQQYDMNFEQRTDVTLADYIEMIRLKTSVLIAAALEIGALIMDAPADEADALYRFGEKIGLAFQLQDDYLDVYGDPATFGKRIGGDILCNKKTYLLIHALQNASPTDRTELQQWLDYDGADENAKIAAVTAIYNRCGVPQACREIIAHYFDEARACLDSIAQPEERKANIWAFATQLMGRQS